MKKQSAVILFLLVVALSLVFIGCPNPSDSDGGTVNLSNVSADDIPSSADDIPSSADDIPSLEKLGLNDLDIPENLDDFKVPAGWTLVTSFDQILGTWVTVMEDEDAIYKSSLKITADKIVMKHVYDYSANENVEVYWQYIKEDYEDYEDAVAVTFDDAVAVTFDDENYIMTIYGETPIAEVSFEDFMPDIALVSTDKKTLVTLSIWEDDETNERDINVSVFIKAN